MPISPVPDPRYIDFPEEYPRGKVVLVSGGTDSLINADTNPDATLLFVDFHADAYGELVACQKLFQDRALEQIIIRPMIPSGDGVFVPARNLMLATLAVHYGDHIIIGAMRDDHSTDKTPRALEMISKILSEQAGRRIMVTAPLRELYKFEAVAFYATTDERRRRMNDTWSCYSRGPYRCFDCKACFRWSVALRYAGINVQKPGPAITKWFLERSSIFSHTELNAIQMALA